MIGDEAFVEVKNNADCHWTVGYCLCRYFSGGNINGWL